MTSYHSSYARRLQHRMLVCCISASVLLPSTNLFGQFGGAAKKGAQKEQASNDTERQLVVFALKHSEASRTREMIEPLLLQIDKGATILEDSRANRLIVRADPNGMLAMESILKILDTPPDKQANQQLATKFIRLRSAPHAEMHDAMRLFLSERGRMSVDSLHNLVIIQDTPDAVAKFTQALAEYDVMARESAEIDRTVQRDATIRIVWLINGVADKDLAVPPEDLNSVVKELAKFGVNDLRLAAQAIVKTTNGRNFEVQSSPEVGNSCEFEVQGELLTSVGEVDNLSIQLSVTEKVPVTSESRSQTGVAPKRLCNLNATVQAPRGQTVVLGVAPTEKRTSVFVVQISEKDQ